MCTVKKFSTEKKLKNILINSSNCLTVFQQKGAHATKTVRRQFYKANVHVRPAIAQPFIMKSNAKLGKLGGASITKPGHLIIGTKVNDPMDHHLYWKQVYAPNYLLTTLKRGEGSVIICAATLWYSTGPFVHIIDGIIANEYLGILNAEVFPMVSVWLPNTVRYHHNNELKHIAKIAQSWLQQH